MTNQWLLQHGWGFDRSFWHEWATQFPGQLADRGYFGSPMALQDNKCEYIVAHSLGLHLLPESVFSQAKVLILISSFASFHEADPKSQTRTALNQMLFAMDKFPKFVLEKFYELCGCSQTVNNQLNIELLKQDLELLNQVSFPLHLLKSIPKILLIHGKEDRIVSPKKSIDLHERLPNSRLELIPGAGHAVPLTHVSEVISLIQKELT